MAPKAPAPKLTLQQRVMIATSGPDVVRILREAKVAIPSAAHPFPPYGDLLAELGEEIKDPQEDFTKSKLRYFVDQLQTGADGNLIDNKEGVDAHASNFATLVPELMPILTALRENNAAIVQREAVRKKREEAESKLNELIEAFKPQAERRLQALKNTRAGQILSDASSGFSRVELLLMADELLEKMNLRISPANLHTLEERRDWAEHEVDKIFRRFGKALIEIGAAVGVGAFLVTGDLAALAGGFLLGSGLVVGAAVALIVVLQKIIVWGFKKLFPIFDEDRFKEKVFQQLKDVLKLIGLKKREVREFGLGPKVLAVTMLALQMEGAAFGRYDQDVDTWTAEFLDSSARVAKPRQNAFTGMGKLFWAGVCGEI